MQYKDFNIARKNAIQEEHLKSSLRLPSGVPFFSHVEFNICGWCNRSCEFCPLVDEVSFPKRKEYFSLDLYRKILCNLADGGYTGRLSYSGFSEPFLHKGVYDMISLTKEILPNTLLEIISNGDVLNAERMRRAYDAGLDRLLISMYDGPEQLEEFESIRREADVPEEWLLLRKRYLAPEESFGINLTNRAGAVTNMQHLGVDPTPETLKHSCYYPHYRMMVDYNGDVLLCPHDWFKRLVVANLETANIIDVWVKGKLDQARRRLGAGDRNFSPCDICDVDGTFQGEKHFEEWQAHYEAMKKNQ